MLFRRISICCVVAFIGVLVFPDGIIRAQVHDGINLSQGGADVVISGLPEGASAGEAVSAGDLNGDGFEDLIVGAPGSTPHGRVGAGAIYIVYGRSGSFPPDFDFTNPILSTTVIEGADAGAGFGASVATGDLNGDGFEDLIAGAPNSDPDGKSDAGSVFVVYGVTGSLPQHVDLADPSSVDLRIDGEAPGDRFGASVSSGNSNGDGFEDLVVGAPGADPNGRTDAGQAYLYYGGLVLSESVRLTGSASKDGLGSSVALGDLNRDGLDELILGAPSATPVGGTGAGIVYVVSGQSAPLPSRLELGASPAGVSRVMGESPRDRTGSSVAVGDVDGDQIGDLIVGARLADPPGGFNAGAVFIVYGQNGGDIPDIDLSGNPPGITRILGEEANDLMGQSVAAGDVNGDGMSDLILGAPGSFLTDDRESESPGKVFVVYGRATFPGVIDLNADPPMVSRILGANGYLPDSGFSDRTGQSVATGDLNGDGFADPITGAPGADPNDLVDAGKAYLFLAGPKPDLRVSSGGLAFGNVVVGQSKQFDVVVTNVGTALLLINTITVSNSKFKALPPGPYALIAGDSLFVGVTFSPTAAGPQSGTLTITTSNDPEKGAVTLPLSGTGAQPDIDVPPSVSFGSVALGSPAVSTLLISNLGSSSLTVRKITSSDNQFVSQPDSLVVPSGAKLRVTIIFTPTVLGATSATLSLLSDDPDEGNVIVGLSGSAATPKVSASVSNLTFGLVLLGSSFELTLTVSNLGDADLSVSQMASDNPQFTVFPTAFTVGGSKDQEVTVTFTPSSTGPQTGTLTLSTNDPITPTLTISATGDGGRQPAIELSASQLNFGTVDVGASRDTTFFVHNRGDGILVVHSVVASDTQFVPQPDSFSVASKDSVQVTLRFSPQSDKDLSAALLISSNDLSSRNSVVTLSGRGAIRVVSEVSADSLEFGEVEVGTEDTLTLTIFSSGNASLIVFSAVSSDSQFVAEIDSSTIAGGDSTQVEVIFSPTALREVSATLTILTNDFVRGVIPVALVGSGARPMRLFLDLDPAVGNQAATTDTIQVSSCSASIGLYLENALNLSSFELTLRLVPAANLMFSSFSDGGPDEENFLRSGGGGLTLSAVQTEINIVKVNGSISNPTLDTAPDGDGLLAVLNFQTFNTPNGFSEGDSAIVQLEQAILTRLVNTGPDTLSNSTAAKLVFSNIPGDCNADGMIDMDDFFLLAGSFGADKEAAAYDPICDINRDEVIDLNDFFLLADRLGTRVESCRQLGTEIE